MLLTAQRASLGAAVALKQAETRLSAGQTVKMSFDAPASQKHFYLDLDARMEMPPRNPTGGAHWALHVEVNGKNVDGERLINYPGDIYQTNSGAYYFAYSKLHQMFRVHYSGDWRPWTGAVSESAPVALGEYPYRYVLDIADLIHPGEANTIEFRNKVRNVDFPIVIRNVHVLDQYQSIRKTLEADIRDLGVITPQAEHRVNYALKVVANGSVEVRVGSESYTIASAFTYPAGKWNHFGPDAKHENEWTIQVENPSESVYLVVGKGKYYQINRRVEAKAEYIDVQDTIRNLSGHDLGVMIKHALPVKGERFGQFRAAGMIVPDQTVTRAEQIRTTENPTIYVDRAHSGLGLFLVDDACRANCYIDATDQEKTLQNQRLALAAGGSYTARLAIFPTDRPDYYAFVNAARRMLDVNFRIDGNMVVGRHWAENPKAVTDQAIRDRVRRHNTRYIVLTNINHPIGPDGRPYQMTGKRTDFIFGPAFMSDIGAAIRHNVEEVTRRIHSLEPGVKVIPYAEWFLSSEPDAESKYADSILMGRDDKPLRYATRNTPYFLPTASNNYGRAVLQYAEFCTRVCDGVFWDESTMPAAMYAYGGWDGYTGQINSRTFKLEKKIQNIALASLPFRVQLIKQIQAAGGVVWQNFEPATMTETKLRTYRFVEGHDPLSGLRTHFYTPISWGDPHEEINDADIVQSIKRTLMHGALLQYYSLVFSKDGNIMQDVFPFTPMELHSGYLIGNEKIITMDSGRFGWGDDSPLSVRIYDRNGYLIPDVQVPVIRKNGETLADVRLSDGRMAIIFHHRNPEKSVVK
ncbi:MAG: hypothetical protein IT447_10050 [Phycisphaerales bacterium]|nr:hypothetical protein [Phycisphaerales bacterium]